MSILTVIVWAAIFAAICGLITQSKGRGWTEGLALGGLLGIFGLIICAFLRKAEDPRVKR